MQKSILPLLLLRITFGAASENLSSPRIRTRRSLTQQEEPQKPRLLQGSDDDYEKDRPCLGEDGVIHYMDQEFDLGEWDFGLFGNNDNGGNRLLGGDSYDGMPDECPTDGQQNGAADYSNTTEPEVLDLNVTSPYPAPITVAPFGVAPEPTVQIPVPAPSPPNQEEEEITLPLDFYKPSVRRLIFCKLSAALPTVSRRRLRSGDGGGSGRGDPSSDDDDMEKQEQTARRFLKEVGEVMGNEIERFSNHTFKVRRGPQGFRRLLESEPRELRPYRPPLDYVAYDGILLVGSRIHENVTYLDTRAPRRSMWWDYTLAFWTVHDNYTYAEEMVAEATMDSIKSGEFFRRLRFHFPRLVAVSAPGEEALHLKGDGNIIDESPPSELDVEDWDARRWVGLGLFLVTLFLTMLLTVTATHRRRKVQQQENWGAGLATEKDINQLLTYGWDYDGHMFHAFEKNKLVYRDDDSMLIGGALLGEIGSAPTTAETPLTDRSPSSQSRSSRSRSSRSISSRSRSSRSGLSLSKSLNGSSSRMDTEQESSSEVLSRHSSQ